MSDVSYNMPPDIAKAIVKVMGDIKKLGKDARNDHGKYNYVSVDQFFDQIGKLLNEAGIFTLVDECNCETSIRTTVDSYGKEKSSAWLTSHYDIFIYHESGVAHGPIKRTIQVSASGPQSYGAGISYVEKYFLRSLFKIPTGEQDADADAQEGLPANGRVIRRAPPVEMMALEESRATRDLMINVLKMSESVRDLVNWGADNTAPISRLLEADRQIVRGAYADKMQSLKAMEKAA